MSLTGCPFRQQNKGFHMEQDKMDGPMACPICTGTIQPSSGTCDGCGRTLSEVSREYEQEQRDSHNTRNH
jgi:hypothetical protein